jgi:hypothetical protein
MQTRSQTRNQSQSDNHTEYTFKPIFPDDYNDNGIFIVEIDFDGASKAWKENKISIGNGSYKYKKQNKKAQSKSKTL